MEGRKYFANFPGTVGSSESENVSTIEEGRTATSYFTLLVKWLVNGKILNTFIYFHILKEIILRLVFRT